MADDLRTLAECVFKLTRRDVWLGGKTGNAGDAERWPKNVERPSAFSAWHLYWTLSPEISLGGLGIRVLVTSRDGEGDHKVRVFVDGEVKHPGGEYVENDATLWTFLNGETWSTRIARQERQDGGRTGPIDRRDLLIAEAQERLHGPTATDRKMVALPKEQSGGTGLDENAVRAVREVEDLLRRKP